MSGINWVEDGVVLTKQYHHYKSFNETILSLPHAEGEQMRVGNIVLELREEGYCWTTPPPPPGMDWVPVGTHILWTDQYCGERHA